MQEQLSQAKNQLENTLVQGKAANGLIVVTLNGAKELKKISIDPQCAGDVDGLQDLILAAFEDALQQLENQMPAPGFRFH